MFINFFYELRREGVPVTITEFLTLIEALNMGLIDNSVLQFYNVTRSILVKSESHYDQYDIAFTRYFDKLQDSPKELYDQVEQWLKNSKDSRYFTEEDRKLLLEVLVDPNIKKMQEALKRRLDKQKKEHHGGRRMIGTGGTSAFGNAGFLSNPNLTAIRIGGTSNSRVATKVSAKTKFKGYRTDVLIDIRQFELALRKLRQFNSKINAPKTELNIDKTIATTCNNGGILQLEWDKPRKNTIKLLILMDEGGSMLSHANLCNKLFSAVNKSTHFKDIRFFYFHNCIYDAVYDNTSSKKPNMVKTIDILKKYQSDYKVIIIGDAAMAPYELLFPHGIIDVDGTNEEAGIWWFKKIANKFSSSVWLNPLPKSDWHKPEKTNTIPYIYDIFPMYELSVKGLEEAIKKLLK